MFTFKDLIDEVKRRATRDQSGTQFDIAIRNIINTSIFRLSREALWRPLRRKATFDTITSYTTGSGGGTFTNGSKNISITGATLITDDVQPGRRISLQGDSSDFVIKTITGETTFTIDKNYSGTTVSGTGTYSILPQEEYNMPIQSSHRLFLWHEDYGYPFMLQYITDQQFYGGGLDNTCVSTPEGYRMWGENWIIEQVKEASVVTVVSSSSSDTNIGIMVHGIVAGYPDSELITIDSSDGTTPISGSKSFSSVEKVTKASSSVGRITATANSGNSTISILPVGDTTAGIKYTKAQLYPLPSSVMPINVQYYKDPVRLVNDYDIHDLGQDFDEAIILLAVGKINMESNKTEGQQFLALYLDEVRSLKKNNVDKIDWFPQLKGRRRGGIGRPHPSLLYQQVGPYYGKSSRL